jgi:peptidoglycan/xylan/chitin deacetylase (PgdA/CDA1 family)
LDGQHILQRITGQTPRFYRAVAGLRNPFLDPILHGLGLQLATWTRRGFDTRERDPDKVLRRLTQDLSAGDILLLHDGHAARTPSGEAVIVAVLPKLLDAIQARNLTPVTLLHACTPTEAEVSVL